MKTNDIGEAAGGAVILSIIMGFGVGMHWHDIGLGMITAVITFVAIACLASYTPGPPKA